MCYRRSTPRGSVYVYTNVCLCVEPCVVQWSGRKGTRMMGQEAAQGARVGAPATVLDITASLPEIICVAHSVKLCTFSHNTPYNSL